MISLISILKEISVQPGKLVKVLSLQWDTPPIKNPKKDPLIIGYYGDYKRRITSKVEFDYWKKDMLENYGPDVSVNITKNPNKTTWTQDDWILKLVNN